MINPDYSELIMVILFIVAEIGLGAVIGKQKEL